MIARMADHHQHRMEVRRAIELRIFSAIAVLDLLLAKGAIDHLASFEDARLIQSLLTAAFAVGVIGFVLMGWQIEGANATDRQRYTGFAGALRSYAESEALPAQLIFPEARREQLRRSWAYTWPAIGLVVIGVACAVAVWNLQIPNREGDPTTPIAATELVPTSTPQP
jgi:hypothetical protein